MSSTTIAPQLDGRSVAIDNLLLHCAKIKPAQRVLFINETDSPSVDRATVEAIAARARELGAEVSTIWASRVPGPDEIPEHIVAGISASDVTIISHNLGGLLRLRPIPGNGIAVHNYAGTDAILDSDWTRVPYELWEFVGGAIAGDLKQRTSWHITCPRGTDIRGTVPADNLKNAYPNVFSTRTFPIGTHQPFSASTANGTLALQWLVSSANHDIGDGIKLDRPVVAEVRNGRIVDVSGRPADTSVARRFLENAGRLTNNDPYRLSSWHAGTNPQAFTAWSDVSHLARWQTLAHNNPRTLHFHVVGEATPGEISLPLIDPIVTLDGDTLWDRGRFTLLERADIREAAKAYDDRGDAFRLNPEIGV
jgi:hypothetical protein